jgi:hypothetical protein
MRWTAGMLAEFQEGLERRRQAAALRPPEQERRGKYKNRRVTVDGLKFDSEKEAGRWFDLVALEKAGQIAELKRQVPFELAPAVHLAGEKRKKPALRYLADATYVIAGQLVVEDTKSDVTRKLGEYRIKKHLMATVHGIHIKEV